MKKGEIQTIVLFSETAHWRDTRREAKEKVFHFMSEESVELRLQLSGYVRNQSISSGNRTESLEFR